MEAHRFGQVLAAAGAARVQTEIIEAMGG